MLAHFLSYGVPAALASFTDNGNPVNMTVSFDGSPANYSAAFSDFSFRHFVAPACVAVPLSVP
jgi:hypothetical protein